MDDQTMAATITGLLASGCGAAIKVLLDQIIRWKAEDGAPISSKTRRRLILLLAALVPSLLYGFMVYMAWVEYGIAAHVAYTGLALFTSQAIHGEQDLPNGAEERIAAMWAEEAFVGNIPQGDLPEARIQIVVDGKVLATTSSKKNAFHETDYSNSGDLNVERGASGGM